MRFEACRAEEERERERERERQRERERERERETDRERETERQRERDREREGRSGTCLVFVLAVFFLIVPKYGIKQLLHNLCNTPQ